MENSNMPQFGGSSSSGNSNDFDRFNISSGNQPPKNQPIGPATLDPFNQNTTFDSGDRTSNIQDDFSSSNNFENQNNFENPFRDNNDTDLTDEFFSNSTSSSSSPKPSSISNPIPNPNGHNSISKSHSPFTQSETNQFSTPGSINTYNNKKPEKSSSNINANLVILSVALGIIALIAIVVAVWLLVNRNQTPKATTPTTTTTSTTTQTEPVTAKNFGFYPSKITNPTSEVIYRLGVHRSTADGNGVFGAYINTSNTAVDLYIYWQYIANYYGVTTDKTERALATISFSQPVVDIVIGETGQSVGGDVLLFLLADGTVEYMPVVKALESQNFKSYGQLAGVKDVVKFYHVDAVSDTGDWSGYVTTLAQRDDGSIVDLQSFMLAALNN